MLSVWRPRNRKVAYYFDSMHTYLDHSPVYLIILVRESVNFIYLFYNSDFQSSSAEAYSSVAVVMSDMFTGMKLYAFCLL